MSDPEEETRFNESSEIKLQRKSTQTVDILHCNTKWDKQDCNSLHYFDDKMTIIWFR